MGEIKVRNKVIYDKQEIIDAAFAIIKREGYYALNARKIAKELNIATMTTYNYVKNIEEIKKEVILKGFSILYEMLFENIRTKQSKLQKDGIVYLCKILSSTLLDFALSYKEIYLFMFTSLSDKFRKDPEVSPFFEFFSKLTPGIKFKNNEEKDQEIRKAFYFFNIIVHGLITDIYNKNQSLVLDEFNKNIDFCISKLFNCKGAFNSF